MPYVADPKDSTTVKNISKQVADQGRQGSFSKQAQDLARGVETPDEPEPPLCSFGLRSPEAAALQLAYVIVGKEHFCESVKTTGGRIYHHGEVSAQLLTLKDAPPRRDWPILTHRQAGAWNSLLGPLMPKMWRRLAAGSRAPWPWPPDQAGKIYPNSTGPPDTLMTDEDERDLKMLKA